MAQAGNIDGGEGHGLLGIGRFWPLCLILGCSGGDPTAADPTLIFEDGFENPLEEVEILAQGGTIVNGLDAWLKLEPRMAALQLRRASDYVYGDCGEMVAWFHGVTGDENLEPQHSGFVCQHFKEPRFKSDNGRWLLTDRSKGCFYYRIWNKQY
ncbi:MAG: hypothetical protein KME65_12980 [Candidatus Thiodiazotropha sp. (ex Ctena orbiculata)]|uniref:Uncharacterized protein n=1 Tax=Candidatus Thiodiazotropha taylori TaxID=2792791 RepID=A0A944M8D5_9GAMM|nr:hypothetical protein [Candidatus Thiodiazotropha taylori]MBV2135661.1 hypothetical protein [Candidatus Thiodiazotropha taylori]PVV18767.1 MAG: hypothetical protein B6D74_15870 [gamma proteobacterium symbiont of Ctena orbiculata]